VGRQADEATGKVRFEMELTTPAGPIKDQFEKEVRKPPPPLVPLSEVAHVAPVERTTRTTNEASHVRCNCNPAAVCSFRPT